VKGFKMATFDRLIRFEAQDGKTYFGDLGKEEVPTREIEGKKVQVLEGSVEGGFKKTGGEATVSKVSPLDSRFPPEPGLLEPAYIIKPC
jgi:transcription initiation factor TFIIH subunit 2